eukprot:GILJ01012570.1.p1 GENE.GILJ01012570.1~~GILJ01012570.1.p1  ORF type:complete len:474 (+),score=75.06 GILJ01012570.1:97-1518(+)
METCDVMSGRQEKRQNSRLLCVLLLLLCVSVSVSAKLPCPEQLVAKHGSNCLKMENERLSPTEAEYLRWARQHGFSDSVTLAQTENGRGIVAVRPLKKGDIFATCGREMHIHKKRIFNSDVGVIFERNPKLKSYRELPYTVFFLHERSKVDSIWKPYLDVLPKQLDTPVFMTDAEIEEYQKLVDINAVHAKQSKLREAHAELMQTIKENNLEYLFGNHAIPFEDYLLMSENVATRTWTDVADSSTQKSDHVESLIHYPVLEMVNHKPTAFVAGMLENGTIALLVDRDVEPGEEVFISYGHGKAASDMANTYGFTIDWTHDKVYLFLNFSTVFINGSSLKQQNKQDAIQIGNVTSDMLYFTLSLNEPISTKAMHILRMLLLTAEERDRSLSDARIGNMVSMRNECAALHFYQSILSQTLHHFKTSLGEDIKILAEPDVPYRKMLAVQVRSGQKRLLKHAIKAVDDYWISFIHSR